MSTTSESHESITFSSTALDCYFELVPVVGAEEAELMMCQAWLHLQALQCDVTSGLAPFASAQSFLEGMWEHLLWSTDIVED